MKTVELHYPMIQFLIISDIAQFRLGNIRSRDALRPIVRERKGLMDYKSNYTMLCKYGKKMRDSWGVFIFSFV